MKINKKIIFIFLGFCCASLLLVFLLIIPLLRQIEKSSFEYGKYKEKLLSFESRFLAIEKIKKDYNDFLEKDIEEIESFFVDFETPIAFLKFLEEMASSSNVSITISLASSESPEKEWGFLDFQIAIKSQNFQELLRFLERVERGHYLVNFKSLNINKGSNSEINSALLIRTYSI